MLSQPKLAAYLGELRCGAWVSKKQKLFLWGAGRKSAGCAGGWASRGAQVAQRGEILARARGRQKGFISGAICISILPALCFFVIHYSAGGLRAPPCSEIPPQPTPHITEHSISTHNAAVGSICTTCHVCVCVCVNPGDIFHPLYFRIFASLDAIQIWMVRWGALAIPAKNATPRFRRTAEASGFAKKTHRDIIHVPCVSAFLSCARPRFFPPFP